ncbi:hypothetical protein K2173_011143 [Erythroxylum novogranatense]|uniref:Uncharacterized protein n=1 Tax=Erythroxylum novogranatense TaxID=1862640 RepID=A0AAV8UCF8_9ROSI|nr:hypothetical protein K2173_011143 [Erythroxylum novogranatense]
MPNLKIVLFDSFSLSLSISSLFYVDPGKALKIRQTLSTATKFTPLFLYLVPISSRALIEVDWKSVIL